MALPEILAPTGTPIFLAGGHAQERESVYRDAAMGTGHARRRRQITAGPRVVSVGWVLTTAEAEAVDAWFENALDVGSRAFAARIARIGAAGLSWVSATWVGPIVWTPLHRGLWRAEGQLLITGEPSQTGPVSTSAAVEFGLPLFATAEIAQFAYAEVEFAAALQAVQLAGVEFAAALLSVIHTFELRDDDSFELRDDDSFELRDEDA